MKIKFLKNVTNFTGKHLVLESLFNKVAGLKTWPKKRLEYRCFPVKFAIFLRKLILKSNCERLLLSSCLCLRNFFYAELQ